MNAAAPEPRAVDWAEVRAGLARAGAALEEALHPSPERARAVLEERARALARVPPERAASAQQEPSLVVEPEIQEQLAGIGGDLPEWQN